MFLPRAFAETDLAALDELMAANPFVTLVTTGADATPCASHLPVLYRREGGRVLLEGHWARQNPQASQAAQSGAALAIVHGPHAYVSPGWYPDKEAAARVPTWNYAVAHLAGTLERFEDEDALADLVARTSAHFESGVGSDWRFEPGRDDHRRQLRGIVGFRLVPDSIALKFKLSQNHPEANRIAVERALAARPDAGARAVADLMRQRRAAP